MVIQVEIDKLSTKLIAIIAALGVCALLVFAALVNCTVGLLSDPQVNVSRELLDAGASFIPNSAPINARLAQLEMVEGDRDIQSIERRAARAINSSPWDYRHRLLLATIKEAEGDREAAERALRDAVTLAPNNTEVHWRLANLLLREGKLARSVVEFRTANSANVKLLPGTLDLLWRMSAGNLPTVRAVTPRDPKSQLVLAHFLLTQKRAPDAITVLSGIERDALVSLPEFPGFIDSLVSEGRIEEARGLWVGLVGGIYAQPGNPLPGIWNGSFESDCPKGLAHFDWAISRNEYATPMLDSNTFRSGARSLRIDFTGRDTTRLDGQVKQTVTVRPGARYRLECYVKTEGLESPGGPRVVVTDLSTSAEIGASGPIPNGSNDWQRIAIDLNVPMGTRAGVVSIKRIPEFSYDKPTRGSIWLDDFVLAEIAK